MGYGGLVWLVGLMVQLSNSEVAHQSPLTTPSRTAPRRRRRRGALLVDASQGEAKLAAAKSRPASFLLALIVRKVLTLFSVEHCIDPGNLLQLFFYRPVTGKLTLTRCFFS